MPNNENAWLCVDIRGYATLIDFDEAKASLLLSTYTSIVSECIELYGGTLFNHQQIIQIARFFSPNDAFLCATELLSKFREFNIGRHKPDRLLVSAGLHFQVGDTAVILPSGKGMNLAERLLVMAEPGSIIMSGDMYRSISRLIDVKAIEYRDVEIGPGVGPMHIYKTLSDYGDEFNKPDSDATGDETRLHIKEIKHIKGNGHAFILTTLKWLTIMLGFTLVVALLESGENNVTALSLLTGWFANPAFYAAIIPFPLFMAALFAERKIHFELTNTGDTERVLGIILSHMGYRSAVKNGNTLHFKPYAANILIFGLRCFYAQITPGGITLSGPYLYMSKLIKMIQRYEQTGQI